VARPQLVAQNKVILFTAVDTDAALIVDYYSTCSLLLPAATASLFTSLLDKAVSVSS